MTIQDVKLGIYEKALPKQKNGSDIGWSKRLHLARDLGFQFVEISIDDSAERLQRLDWSRARRQEFHTVVVQSGLTVPSLCFSGHRKYPLGSHHAQIREKSRNLLRKAIQFAVETGIRTIQLPSYDVYGEEHGDTQTKEWFIEGLSASLQLAARENVMLALENMDTVFMNSIVRYLNISQVLDSPWLTLYPDVGNLSAWGKDVAQELELGFPHIVAIHLKDTQKVERDFPGKFRGVPFGTGCVDFPELFRTLKRLKYMGPFLIEMWGEATEEPVAAIRRARTWIIEQMKAGGYIDG